MDKQTAKKEIEEQLSPSMTLYNRAIFQRGRGSNGITWHFQD